MNSRARSRIAVVVVAGLVGAVALAGEHGNEDRRHEGETNVQVGPRPYYLVDNMEESRLKDRLLSCSEKEMHPTKFSIAHRGAPLQFPEETEQALRAGARMGAGILECDVTFTKDRQLVCRHDQCDLHTTTNILTVPALAARCTKPFAPADPVTGTPASAQCCTSDITLQEFKSLCGKMDGSNPLATTPEQYQHGTPSFRTDLYATCGTVLSHDEYIDLVDGLGRDFTPELKTPVVAMPFQGTYTQQQFAQQMIDAYKSRNIFPRRVYAQSFLYDDILYWIRHDPAFGRQAVFLDPRVDLPGGYQQAVDGMGQVARDGVKIIAPPSWALVTTDSSNHIVPSTYARAAKRAGLDIITWSLERSGPLATTGRSDYYFQSITPAIHRDGDTYVLIDVLARQVGVRGIFSDWAGTVTYYANCIEPRRD